MASEHDNASESIQRAGARDAFYRIVGALEFSEALVSGLSAQNLRTYDHIKREKLYLEAGYQTFDDFLDHDPHSRIKSEAFRRRWNLLKDEGDNTFNLLNSLKVPVSQRALMAGEVVVEGDIIKIGEIECDLSDAERIIQVIDNLHSKTLEQERTTKRLSKQIDQAQKDFEALKRRAVVNNPDGTDTGQALLTCAGAVQRLKESLASASDEEKKALSEPVFEFLRIAQLECSVALGVVSKDEIPNSNEDEDGDR